MGIQHLRSEFYQDFIEFNDAINSNRNDAKQRFESEVLANPLLENKSQPHILVAFDGNHQIVGQHLHNPFEYCYGCKINRGFFGYDFYVLEKCRGQGIGYALASESDRQFFPHFGLGVSEKSKKILLSLNNRVIGNLYIFIWLKNVKSLFRLMQHVLLKNKSENKEKKIDRFLFPGQIQVAGKTFNRIDSLPLWRHNPMKNDILEFSRSMEFLKWRFFSRNGKYAFYLLNEPDSNTYFVTRIINTKGLNLLTIVDYRFSFEDKKKFELILRASKFLARYVRCDGVFTMSSHKFFDTILKNNLFIKRMKPINLLTNAPFDFAQHLVESRQNVFATMADSDLDYYFKFQEVDMGNGKN